MSNIVLLTGNLIVNQTKMVSTLLEGSASYRRQLNNHRNKSVKSSELSVQKETVGTSTQRVKVLYKMGLARLKKCYITQRFTGYNNYFALCSQISENPLKSSSNWVNWSDLCFGNINLAMVWRMN